jgi:hypothetical protein
MTEDEMVAYEARATLPLPMGIKALPVDQALALIAEIRALRALAK